MELACWVLHCHFGPVLEETGFQTVQTIKKQICCWSDQIQKAKFSFLNLQQSTYLSSRRIWIYLDCLSQLPYNTIPSYLEVKGQKNPYEIKWSIQARGHAVSSGSWACNLCLIEKLVILAGDQNSMLNKRDELLETCGH